MTSPLRYTDRPLAVKAACELAAKYGTPFEVREITEVTVWDPHYAKYVPRSCGWAKWEVVGPNGLHFRPPNGYEDPEAVHIVDDVPRQSSGLSPPEGWTNLDGWNEYGPDADQFD